MRGGRAPGFRAWERDARRRSGRRRSSAPPTSSRRGAGALIAPAAGRGAARPSTTRSRRSARRSISAATTRRRAAASSGPGEPMPGPTGEENVLRLRGRGVFVAHLARGTFRSRSSSARSRRRSWPATASSPSRPSRRRSSPRAAVRLLHEAGVPAAALQLVPGDGAVGARARRSRGRRRRRLHRLDRGRAARSTGRSPRRDGPIVPLIAETGGINAMIVDATALPEQVARRRRHLGVPLGRPALLGAPAALRPGGRRRPMIAMIVGAAPRAEARRPARPERPYRPGHRRGGQGAARCPHRAHAARGEAGLACGFSVRRRPRSKRPLRRAARLRARPSRRPRRGGVRADPACGALPAPGSRRACSTALESSATA